VIGSLAERYGRLVDLHALSGDASWFARTIEPSVSRAAEKA